MTLDLQHSVAFSSYRLFVMIIFVEKLLSWGSETSTLLRFLSHSLPLILLLLDLGASDFMAIRGQNFQRGTHGFLMGARPTSCGYFPFFPTISMHCGHHTALRFIFMISILPQTATQLSQKERDHVRFLVDNIKLQEKHYVPKLPLDFSPPVRRKPEEKTCERFCKFYFSNRLYYVVCCSCLYRSVH